VVTLFGNKLPPNATYFITFVALQWVLASHKDPSFYLYCVLLVYIVMTAWEQVNLYWQFDLSEASFFCLEPNFFFLPGRFFVGYGLELSRLVPLTIYHLKRKYLCKTEKEVEEAWAPGPLTYETLVPNDMLIVTITLCYSVISPIILIFGLLYFGIGWLVLRNQVWSVFPSCAVLVFTCPSSFEDKT
jgi:hypothetical protein